jgi:hypothetical protein
MQACPCIYREWEKETLARNFFKEEQYAKCLQTGEKKHRLAVSGFIGFIVLVPWASHTSAWKVQAP